MNQNDQLITAEVQLLECGGIVDLFHGLNFREVVAATDRAKRGAEEIRVKPPFGESLLNVAFPGVLQIQAQLSPALDA